MGGVSFVLYSSALLLDETRVECACCCQLCIVSIYFPTNYVSGFPGVARCGEAWHASDAALETPRSLGQSAVIRERFLVI
jgi:hypothetical protein